MRREIEYKTPAEKQWLVPVRHDAGVGRATEPVHRRVSLSLVERSDLERWLFHRLLRRQHHRAHTTAVESIPLSHRPAPVLKVSCCLLSAFRQISTCSGERSLNAALEFRRIASERFPKYEITTYANQREIADQILAV